MIAPVPGVQGVTMPRLFSALVAEAIGVFALSFIGILARNEFREVLPMGLLGIALAHGLILSIMITIFGATSGGHFNPAITIGMLVGGKIKLPEACGYVGAQIFGGLLAGVAIMAI